MAVTHQRIVTHHLLKMSYQWSTACKVQLNLKHISECKLHIHPNARRRSNKRRLPMGNVLIQIKDDPPPHQKWRLLEDLYYYVIHLLHKACQILSTFTNQRHCLHLHSHSSTVFVSHIQCIGNTAFCNTLYNCFWWDVLPFCYDPHWLNNTSAFLGLWTYLKPTKIHNFRHRWCQWS